VDTLAYNPEERGNTEEPLNVPKQASVLVVAVAAVVGNTASPRDGSSSTLQTCVVVRTKVEGRHEGLQLGNWD